MTDATADPPDLTAAAVADLCQVGLLLSPRPPISSGGGSVLGRPPPLSPCPSRSGDDGSGGGSMSGRSTPLSLLCQIWQRRWWICARLASSSPVLPNPATAAADLC
jgi:hypothetical protein